MADDKQYDDQTGASNGVEDVTITNDTTKRTGDADGSQTISSGDNATLKDNVPDDGDKGPDDGGDGGGKASEEGDDNDFEWLDVLGSGHLKKKVVRAGQGESTRCDRGMMLTVTYQGFLQDGTEVDSQENFTFVQGEGEVVQAIDLCVCFMELGEVAEIKANSRFAYGEYGNGPRIPPNTDLVYTVELLKIDPPPAPITMTVEECCQLADKKRKYGNDMFSRRDYSGAINSYSRALKLLEEAPSTSEEDLKKDQSDLVMKCHNNLAAAQLKIEAYSAALKSCNCVLQMDDKNVKALFRKGKVLACQKEFTEAVIVMKKALAVEPANKTIHQELSKLTSRRQEDMRSEKEMYQRMVGDMANVTDVPAAEKKFGAKWLLIGLSIVIAAVAVVIAVQMN